MYIKENLQEYNNLHEECVKKNELITILCYLQNLEK